mgnify:CR=1 FL=1
MPTTLDVIDASECDVGDQVLAQAPTVGLNQVLKIGKKIWIWSRNGEKWSLELPYPVETLTDALIDVRASINALIKTTQNIEVRENEET